jgi:hypothetical protein
LAIGIPVTILAMKSGALASIAEQSNRERDETQAPQQTRITAPPVVDDVAVASSSPLQVPELLGPPSPLDSAPSVNHLVAQQVPMPGAEKPGAINKPAAPTEGDGGAEGVRKRWASKRRNRLTDEELRRQLLLAPEVDLDSSPGTVRRVISASGKAANKGIDIVPQVVLQRPDLLGLPMQFGALARKGAEESLNLMVLSQQLRQIFQIAIPGVVGNIVDPRPDPDLLRRGLLNNPAQAATLLRP